LKIFVKEAKLIHDDRLLTRMDPFALIQFRGIHHKTPVCHDGNHNPRWVSEFEIKVEDMFHELKYEVYDSKALHNEPLGGGMVRLQQLVHNHGVIAWFDLFHGTRVVG